MPPLALLPGRPAGAPDIISTGYGGGMNPTATGAARGGTYQYEGHTVPRATPEDPYAEVRWWNMHTANINGQAMKEQNAFNKLQLQNQREDAEKALKNAMQIAQLTAETSRYGTDVASRDRLAALEVNQEQFRANHALDQQKFGLDVAKTYTQFASTYDDLFALQDLKGAIGSIGAGQGVAPLGSQGQPHAKNWNDFYALTGYGSPMAGAGAAQGGGSTGTDPRVTAANAVMKALPPSQTAGNDPQDWNAINAITSLYFGAKPGEVEKLGQERQKAAQGGLARAGFNPRLVDEERKRSLPGQGSVRAY